MAIPFAITPLAGVDFTQAYTPGSSTGYPYKSDQPGIAVGTQVTGTRATEWVYVLVGTGGITGLGYAVVIDPTNTAVMTSAAGGTMVIGNRIGIAPAAASAGDYIWVQVYGPVDAMRAAAAAAANTQLLATATAGALDDAGTHNLSGIVFTTAATGAGNFAGELNYPVVAS